MTPKILVSGEIDAFENYENALRGCGGQPVSGYCPAPDLSCAGLLLCGGGDVDPALFHQEDRGSNPPDPARDAAELALIDAFFRAGRPILGICRGLQVLNVALGGTLIQDLPPHALRFHRRPAGDQIHPIHTKPDSLMRRLYGPHLAVTSMHHQAVDRAADCLIPTAWSETGFAEVLEHPTRPILGVQFHPERMTGAHLRPDTADGGAIFRWFVDQCRAAL